MLGRSHQRVGDVDIAALFDRSQPTEDADRALVERANSNGGRDNITVIVADLT